MHPKELDLIPRRAEGAVTTVLPDGFVAIVQVGKLTGFTLSPSGALFWELCDGTMSVSQIADQVFALISEVYAENAGAQHAGESPEALSRAKLQQEFVTLVKDLVADSYLFVT